MKKFEVGKRYKDGAMTLEVIKRTAKTAQVAVILHANKVNEKIREVKKIKVHDWDIEEVMFFGSYEFHA